jgi:hypothetical protein
MARGLRRAFRSTICRPPPDQKNIFGILKVDPVPPHHGIQQVTSPSQIRPHAVGYVGGDDQEKGVIE